MCNDEPSRSDILNSEAADCEASGDWAGAESAYKQILEQLNQGLGVDFSTLRRLSQLYYQLGRQAEALSYASAAVAATEEKDVPVLVCVSLDNQARLLIHCGQIAEARLKIEKALVMIDGDQLYNNIRAGLLILLAQCQVVNGELFEADENLATALNLFGNWKDFEVAAGIQSDMARWWSVQGMIHTARHEFDRAVNAWRQAVEIRQRIDTLEHCQDVYTRAGVARTLPGLANSLRDAGRPEEAELVGAEAEEILAALGLPST